MPIPNKVNTGYRYIGLNFRKQTYTGEEGNKQMYKVSTVVINLVAVQQLSIQFIFQCMSAHIMKPGYMSLNVIYRIPLFHYEIL